MKAIIPKIGVVNCREALDFYKRAFGGKVKNIEIKTDGEKGDKEGEIFHSELHINEYCVLYFYECSKKPEGNIDIILELESESEIGMIYDALGAEGTALEKLDKQMWGAYRGVVLDKYNNKWTLICMEN